MQASKPHLPVGGRLKYFINEWYKLTSDPSILDTVKGMHINLDSIPRQKHPPPQLKLSAPEIAAANDQIQKLLTKKAIMHTKTGQKGEFVSNVFLRPKKDGGFRMILNLKKFNKSVHYDHFKMETLQHILTLVVPHCYMAIFDLQDAYLVVSIAGIHIKFLKFTWQGKTYMYIVMLFGLAEAPKKFTKLLKPELSKLRRMGITLAIYIDDGWVRAQTFAQCVQNMITTMKLFAKVGFLLHKEKSVPVPKQQVSILGYEVDSVTMLVTLGDDKTVNAISLCKDGLCGRPMPIRFLAKIIGTLISLFPACPMGRARYRSLEAIKIHALNVNKWNWDANCEIFGQAVKDLKWWIMILPHTAAPITRNSPNMTIYSDASNYGWGAQFGELRAQGKFDVEQQQFHINTKEVIAAYYAVKSFRPYFDGNHLLLRCDNTTAIANIRDMGTLLSPVRDDFCRMLWQQMYEKDCWLSINFVPGVDNCDADAASRIFNDRTEWSLPVPIFCTIAEKFGLPTIDLFASRLNRKVQRYVSWTPDPFCTEVDAFYYQWNDEFPYIYPPFNLLNRCTKKIIEDQVKRAIVIFPLWPTQHWFAPLLELAISHVFLLPEDPPIYLP